MPTDDFGSTVQNHGTVAVGGTVTGTIESRGDRDWFAVQLIAGTTYRFDLEGSPTQGFGRFILRLRDSNGNFMGSNHDGEDNPNSQFSFTAGETGTYYVSAAAGRRDRLTGTYNLGMVADDDFGNNSETSGLMEVGGSVTGKIESRGDRDWFAVQLIAGTTYRFDLEGSPTQGFGRFILRLRDSNGNFMGSNHDGEDNPNSQFSFTAGETGTYYVSAAAGRRDRLTGTYNLSMVADDFANNSETSGLMEVGGTVTGTIESRGDRDWFAVQLTAGTSYQFNLEGTPTQGFGRFILRLRDRNGNLMGNNHDGKNNPNSQFSFTAGETETYYISAAAGRRDRLTGTYNLGMVADDDFGNNPETLGRLQVGGSVTGTIESRGDQDWFAVQLIAGTTYRFDLGGSSTGQGTLSDPYFRLYDSNGNLVGENNNGGDNSNSQFSFTARETGTYYASAAGHGDTLTGTYNLGMVATDDFGNNSETSGLLEVGGSVRGKIDFQGDRDWFAVQLIAGTTYRFDLKNPGGTFITCFLTSICLLDPYFRLYDSNGNLVGYTNNGGHHRDSRYPFTPEDTGTYYASASSKYNSDKGDYTLSVVEVPVVADDFGNNSNTLGRVEVGGSVTGTIEYDSDPDWFAVQLIAGTTYRFDLGGSPTGQGTLSDPYFRLYNSLGYIINDNDDGGSGYNSRFSFTAPETGTYYAAAGGYGRRTGTYTLSVKVTDDFGNNSDTLGRVEVGGSVTGTIESQGDQDWFAVQLTAGTTYRFDLEGTDTAPETLSDPYFRLYDSNSNLVGENNNGEDGLNSQFSFTAPSTGTYYASAGADGISTGTYNLGVVEVADDFI